MCSVSVLLFAGLFTATVGLGVVHHTGHLYIGQLADNLRQFPHHVFIVVPETGQKCGGSVLNRRWVLTSAFCVKGSDQLDLYFRKRLDSAGDGDDFLGVSVDREQVFVYPTKYDDIALVKLPISLEYSQSLAQMNISRLSLEALRGRYTVMPALSDFIVEDSTTLRDEPVDSTTVRTTESSNRSAFNAAFTLPTPRVRGTTLKVEEEVVEEEDLEDQKLEDEKQGEDGPKYGMFNVLENRICKQVYGGAFDEYTQLCIESWGDSPNRPCDSDYGTGLIVGWPAKGEIVGLFHMYSPSCENRQPTIFTFTGKYLPWIESLINGDN